MIVELFQRSKTLLLYSQKELAQVFSVISSQENKNINSVFIYSVDVPTIISINNKFLNHDYSTDIITFPYSYSPIEIEMFLCPEQININALDVGVDIKQEQMRVIIHGILHMCGYDDKNEEDVVKMRERENYYLSLCF